MSSSQFNFDTTPAVGASESGRTNLAPENRTTTASRWTLNRVAGLKQIEDANCPVLVVARGAPIEFAAPALASS